MEYSDQQNERRGKRAALWVIGSLVVAVGIGVISSVDDSQTVVVADSRAASQPGAVTQFNFAASIEATSRLESYRIDVVQNSGTLTIDTSVLQVGLNSEVVTVFNGVARDLRTVDGRSYEFNDGVWYLVPSTAREIAAVTELSELTESLLQLPAVERGRTADAVTLELTCGTKDRDNVAPAIAAFCDDRVDVVASIDLHTNLLTTIRAEGDIETYPEEYQQGFAEIRVEPVERHAPITAPEVVDVSRYDCVGEIAGASDYIELSVALDGNTTRENGDLFRECGFRFYPPGNDFQTS